MHELAEVLPGGETVPFGQILQRVELYGDQVPDGHV